MKLIQPFNTLPPRVQLLFVDTILDAVWNWEVSRHGKPEKRYHGRAVFEAVMELQEWIMEKDKA